MTKTIEKNLGDISFTDAVDQIARQFKARWLITDIIAYQMDPAIANIPFQVWAVTVNADETGKLTCTDGNGKHVFEQGLMFTNFPEPGIELLCVDGVIMLPSEY